MGAWTGTAVRAWTKGPLFVGGTLAAAAPAQDRVRVYEVVRTAHLERAHEYAPAAILYRDRRYDFDETLTSGLDLVQCSLLRLVTNLLRRDVAVLEINEPLMRSGLVRAVAAVSAVRLRGVLTRRRCRVVTYAIANFDEFCRPAPRWRSHLRRWLDRRLARTLARGLDRIVYGTPGSRDLYRHQLGPHLVRARSTLIPALPAPCPCPRGSRADHGVPLDGAQQDRHGVVFVGAFDDRKGVEDLLRAWPSVAAVLPTARLHLLGKGPLEERVRAFVDETPRATVTVDPPRDLIHRVLRDSRVLVLFSVRTPLWREQVGLPIVEGLSHGCTIVCSDETGLAEWLGDHGHTVVPAGAGTEALAGGVVTALTAGPDRAAVLATLPTVDGRRAADEWLFAPDASARVRS